MRKISKIETTIPILKPKKRVAAYARVSLPSESLMHSLSAQISYYSTLIQKNPEWTYVGVYADEGITGTSIRKRDEFNSLIADCDAGKIDLVLTKSISRFARNTVDLLETVRHLKDIGVEVQFERENIRSMSGDGELMMTILASFAQEESRSISENVKWGIRKRFQQGIQNGHKAPYGYKWDGKMYRVIPEQGEVVAFIYQKYLAGDSAYKIARDLEEKGIIGQVGVPMEESTVKDVLSNLSYMGTMILQKYYFTDGHVRKKNNGELPRYIVEDMYEPLVSIQVFNSVQEIRQRRAEEASNKNPNLTVFSGLVKCGTCGCSVSRRTTQSTKKWLCYTRERKGKSACDMRFIQESELIEAATKALGTNELEERMFKKEIELITIFDDRIEFNFKNGRKRSIIRTYGGYKGRSGFSGKVKCGICGAKCESDTWKWSRQGQEIIEKVWVCCKPRCECTLNRIFDTELRKAASIILNDENYEAKFVKEIKETLAYNDRLEFMLKDGTVETWQRE